MKTPAANGYYVPTLDEFHVGFHFEEAGEPLTFGIHTASLDQITRQLMEGSIRVKVLDEEDVKSFGFVKDSFNEMSDVVFRHGVRTSISLSLRQQANSAYITVWDHELDMYFYRGRCNNVDRLNQLLLDLFGEPMSITFHVEENADH